MNATGMSPEIISTVILPGVVALLLFLVFTYLHEQSRQPYFRAWQFAWAAYTLHFLLDAWSSVWERRTAVSFLASMLLVAMAICVLVSTRLTGRLTTSERRNAFWPRWYEWLAAALCTGFGFLNVSASPCRRMRSPSPNSTWIRCGCSQPMTWFPACKAFWIAWWLRFQLVAR